MFLKYYHIEQLSRRFEEQQRRVVMAQAVIRMWIQKKRFRKRKSEMIEGAIQIQRSENILSPLDACGVLEAN